MYTYLSIRQSINQSINLSTYYLSSYLSTSLLRSVQKIEATSDVTGSPCVTAVLPERFWSHRTLPDAPSKLPPEPPRPPQKFFPTSGSSQPECYDDTSQQTRTS